MNTGMHIVLYGNPVDGLKCFGPFKTPDDALRWASGEIDDTWWLAPLGHPDEFSAETDSDACQHCSEERGLGPDTGSTWTCGACNGLNT